MITGGFVGFFIWLLLVTIARLITPSYMHFKPSELALRMVIFTMIGAGIGYFFF